MSKILIVEDNLAERDILCYWIRNHFPHFVLNTSADAGSAISLIDDSVKNNEPYDVFLLDIRLSDDEKDRGGYEVAQYLKSRPVYRKTPILFLTILSDEIRNALSDFHCYDFITKPFDELKFIKVIRQLISYGYISNSISLKNQFGINTIIETSGIYYITIKKGVVYIHTCNGIFDTRSHTLLSIKKLLPDSFLFCHKSFIVNTKYITRYTNTHITLSCDPPVNLPLGRGYKGEIASCFIPDDERQ